MSSATLSGSPVSSGVVKKVRFPEWQHTSQGERLVQRELRRTLLRYKLHTDQELFDKAYSYIRQYY
jgi:type I restriction enzyme R subunit